MKQLRQAILWCVLGVIGLVALLSILGAFLGALTEYAHRLGLPEDAKSLFNSAPLVVFWFILLALLAAGLIFFRRLVATPAGLAMHLGTVLVVAGAMWGSDKAHALRAEWLGSEKAPSGFMVLYKGQTDDHILADDMTQRVGTLPFRLSLDDFRIEYYSTKDQPWGLVVVATLVGPQGAEHEHQAFVDWKMGQATRLQFTPVQLTVLEYLDRARAAPGGEAVPDPDSPQPAMKVLLECNGRRRQAWLVPKPGEQMVSLQLGPIIEDVPDEGEVEGPDLYFVAPRGDVSAYKSDVTVIEGDEAKAEATIEVNHPLHWGGYHFYQFSYDRDRESYTILEAVSDSGLWAVYLGLFLLVAGAFGRFWLQPAWAYLFPGGSGGH